jgi:hypothetical protein
MGKSLIDLKTKARVANARQQMLIGALQQQLYKTKISNIKILKL